MMTIAAPLRIGSLDRRQHKGGRKVYVFLAVSENNPNRTTEMEFF